MRIHRLKLQAYGPFPGTIDLDFEELNQAGIFLLNGPTGSGKSSILDAICFALYGTTSLARPDLKSHFAPADRVPRVELDCTVGETRLHIERSPKWERPKKRGSGTITEQANVLVQRQSREDPTVWEDKATRNDEAGSYITQLVGLTREQFTQVMLLPQGQFARFLNAKSGEREDLLKKLFPTLTYERVQEILLEQSRQAAEKAEKAEAQLTRLEDDARAAFERVEADLMAAVPVAESVETEEQTEKEEETAPETFEEWLASSRELVSASMASRNSEKDAVLAGLEKSRAQFQTLQDRVKAWNQFELLSLRLSELEKQEPEHTERTKMLNRARVAAPVIPAARALTRAQSELNSAEKALDEQKKALTQQVDQHPLTHSEALESSLVVSLGKQLPETAEIHELAQQELQQVQQKLRELSTQQAQLTQDQKALNQLDEKLTLLTKDRSQLEEQQKDLAQKLEAHTLEYAELQSSLKPLEIQEQAVETAQTQLKQAQQLQKVKAQHSQASALAVETEQKRLAATHHSEELQHTRYAQASLLLASELTPDSACPVCGSLEHPAPARGETGTALVEAQDVDAARAARDRAEAAAREAQEKATALASTIDSLVANGAEELEQAQEKLGLAQQELKHAKEEHRHLAQLEARGTQLQQQEQKLTTQVQQLEINVATTRERRTAVAEQVEKLTSAVLKHQHSEINLRERENLVRSLSTALSTLHQAQRDFIHAQGSLARSQEELASVLDESPFETVEQAQQHYRSAEQQAQLEQTIRTFETALTEVKAQLDQPASQDIQQRIHAGESKPAEETLAALREQIASEETQRDSLTASITRLTGAQQQLKTAASTFTRQSEQFASVVEDYRMRKFLADIANGNTADNSLAMSLTTFVLAAQLEEVTAAATGHLETMTHGRYQLRYTDEKQARGKSGLGIAVHDTWHSTTRLPATLSGGETFMASLSLALGLADVVQARNGGIEIDTLFVDEGFGSLDDSTLEEVMSTLDSLRERGRVIGLISHVNELKNRIPHHVQIRTSPEGSYLDTAPQRAE